MKDYADKYIDVETNGRWLVKAIMELIESDIDIKGNTRKGRRLRN